MLKDWLRLFRAQTAPATVITCCVAYLLNNNNLITFLSIFVYATLLHWVCFGHNSVMDYHYDIKNKRKTHHPLPSGTISYERANMSIHTLLILLTIVFYPLFHPAAISLFFFSIYLVTGFAYNCGMGKLTIHSYAPITICFTSLFLTFYTLHHSLDFRGVVTAFYIAHTIFFQIAFEGNLKDIESDPMNLLRTFGVEVNRFLKIPKSVSAFFMLVKSYSPIIPLICIKPTYSFGYALVWVGIIVTALIMMTQKEYRHELLLELFGVEEVLSAYLLLFFIPPTYAVMLAIYGVSYFVLMNKLLWGSRFGPRV